MYNEINVLRKGIFYVYIFSKLIVTTKQQPKNTPKNTKTNPMINKLALVKTQNRHKKKLKLNQKTLIHLKELLIVQTCS